MVIRQNSTSISSPSTSIVTKMSIYSQLYSNEIVVVVKSNVQKAAASLLHCFTDDFILVIH